LSQGDFDGAPFELHPVQKFIIGSIFGWKKANGKRRFRRVYIEIAKGAGKSPLAAGIALYCLVADGEAQGQVYSAASMKPQARVVFDFAVRMWEQSPALRKALTPTGKLTVQNLAHLASGSYFRPVSEDEGKLSGPMPSCAICDEVHEHKTAGIIRMLERGFKSRTQPLLIMITNSGSDRTTVCWEEHQRAVHVAAGTETPDDDATFVGEVIDDNEFAFVCGLDRDDTPLEDEGCWVKANPLIGVTFPLEEMRRVVAQAKAIPGSMNLALRLHFCVWTDAETAWMSRPTIDAVLADFDPLDHSGDRLMAGVDLSASQDLTAVAFIVETGSVDLPDDKGGVVNRPTYDAWVEAWTPGDTALERSKRDNQPYDLWISQGLLNAPPGRLIRMDFVAARIAEVQAEYELIAIAYDAYAFRRNFGPELDKLGVTVPLLEHPQGGKRRARPTSEQIEAAKAAGKEAEGLWMPGSLSELEAMILEKRIRIRRSPVIVSAIMGATIEEDAFGNRWFSKGKRTARIDPLVALAMAVGAVTTLPAGETHVASPWDDPSFRLAPA
jgi:phage terminase large subunit-like protein